MWKLALVMIGVLSAVKGAEAGEFGLACPGELAAGAVRAAGAPPGWQLYNPNRLVLHSAAFMGGAPEKMMDLVPFEVKNSKGIGHERWKFEGGEVWLRCAYGEAGRLFCRKGSRGRRRSARLFIAAALSPQSIALEPSRRMVSDKTLN
jgi:hypothetical protein